MDKSVGDIVVVVVVVVPPGCDGVVDVLAVENKGRSGLGELLGEVEKSFSKSSAVEWTVGPVLGGVGCPSAALDNVDTDTTDTAAGRRAELASSSSISLSSPSAAATESTESPCTSTPVVVPESTVFG